MCSRYRKPKDLHHLSDKTWRLLLFKLEALAELEYSHHIPKEHLE